MFSIFSCTVPQNDMVCLVSIFSCIIISEEEKINMDIFRLENKNEHNRRSLFHIKKVIKSEVYLIVSPKVVPIQ